MDNLSDELACMAFLIILFDALIIYTLVERGLKREFGRNIKYWWNSPVEDSAYLGLYIDRLFEYHRLRKVKTGKTDIKVLFMLVTYALAILMTVIGIVSKLLMGKSNITLLLCFIASVLGLLLFIIYRIRKALNRQ